jgi:hypothetical protein
LFSGVIAGAARVHTLVLAAASDVFVVVTDALHAGIVTLLLRSNDVLGAQGLNVVGPWQTSQHTSVAVFEVLRPWSLSRRWRNRN